MNRHAISDYDPDPRIQRIPKGCEEGGEDLCDEDKASLRRGDEYAQDLLWDCYRKYDLRCLCTAGGRRKNIRHNRNSPGVFHRAFFPGERPDPGEGGCWFCLAADRHQDSNPDSTGRLIDGLHLLLRRPRIRPAPTGRR